MVSMGLLSIFYIAIIDLIAVDKNRFQKTVSVLLISLLFQMNVKVIIVSRKRQCSMKGNFKHFKTMHEDINGS